MREREKKVKKEREKRNSE